MVAIIALVGVLMSRFGHVRVFRSLRFLEYRYVGAWFVVHYGEAGSALVSCRLCSGWLQVRVRRGHLSPGLEHGIETRYLSSLPLEEVLRRLPLFLCLVLGVAGALAVRDYLSSPPLHPMRGGGRGGGEGGGGGGA